MSSIACEALYGTTRPRVVCSMSAHRRHHREPASGLGIVRPRSCIASGMPALWTRLKGIERPVPGSRQGAAPPFADRTGALCGRFSAACRQPDGGLGFARRSASGTVLDELATGERPAGVAIAADGSCGVVTHWYGYDLACSGSITTAEPCRPCRGWAPNRVGS